MRGRKKSKGSKKMSLNKGKIKTVEEISVREFFNLYKEALQLEVLGGADGLDRIIYEPSLNRPALAITGYFKNFAAKRVQLFGAGEMAYMRDLPDERQSAVMGEILEREVPCVVISRNLDPTPTMLEAAEKFKIPLLRTKLKSKDFSAEMLVRFDRLFAPRMSLHGTLLDIKGIGTLIRGSSGIGKSECALELIDHGHSLVADDHVYCTRISDSIVLGRGNELNRGYMECRGIGILNGAELFGIRCVDREVHRHSGDVHRVDSGHRRGEDGFGVQLLRHFGRADSAFRNSRAPGARHGAPGGSGLHGSSSAPHGARRRKDFQRQANRPHGWEVGYAQTGV